MRRRIFLALAPMLLASSTDAAPPPDSGIAIVSAEEVGPDQVALTFIHGADFADVLAVAGVNAFEVFHGGAWLLPDFASTEGDNTLSLFFGPEVSPGDPWRLLSDPGDWVFANQWRLAIPQTGNLGPSVPEPSSSLLIIGAALLRRKR